MKPKSFLFGIILFLNYLSSLTVKAQQKNTSPEISRPKLVVGIVVDQMRWDYLYRYYGRYSSGGFKRMLNEGFSCEDTQINYITTVTAAGHASIYTGTSPSIHGITGNDFVVGSFGKTIYCTGDTGVKGLGNNGPSGQMSPKNLLSTTLTDELKMATNFRSKVIGISLKDRGAILPAGHCADAAYWFDDQAGGWISSSFYMKNLPTWVREFNELQLHAKYLKQNWNTIYPVGSYHQSAPDNSTYEKKFQGMDQPTLPVATGKFATTNTSLIRSTPFGNTLTLDFAKTAILKELMGNHKDPDFLAISLSSTDYIGHQFGPNAVETEDTYLRLDKDLGNFFSFLDRQIGKGGYTVFLTADHGASHNASFLKQHYLPSGVWDPETAKQALNLILNKKYGKDNLVLGFHNFQLNLDIPSLEQSALSQEEIVKDCISYLKTQDGVLYAIDLEKAPLENIPQLLKNKIVLAYHPQRSGHIQLVLQPGWYFGSDTKGATHGSPTNDNSHIPLLFMGYGIKHGKLKRRTSISDIAATMASLMHIQAPNGSIGNIITEVFTR